MRIEFKLGKTDEQSNTNHMNLWLSVDIQPSSHQFLEFWRLAAEAAACKLIIYMYLSRCMCGEMFAHMCLCVCVCVFVGVCVCLCLRTCVEQARPEIIFVIVPS
jgi:hypothetical protein